MNNSSNARNNGNSVNAEVRTIDDRNISIRTSVLTPRNNNRGWEFPGRALGIMVPVHAASRNPKPQPQNAKLRVQGLGTKPQALNPKPQTLSPKLPKP